MFRLVGAGALASPRNGGLITSNPDGSPRGGALGSIEQLELLVCEKLYIVIEEIWSDDLEALIRRYVAPAKIRLNVASFAAAENLSNERSAPARTSEVTLKLN